MKFYLAYVVIFYSVFQGNHGLFGNTFTKFRELVEKHRKWTYLKHAGINALDEVEGYAFDQRLDHFEVRPNPRLFRQRYWRNKVYWKEPNGPVFLYVGGEGALSGVEIDGGKLSMI